MPIVTVDVNGVPVRLDVAPHERLVETLRERLGLTGAKPACLQGACGACSVLIDGVPVYSCLTLTAACDGAHVETVEGLVRNGSADLVDAFVAHDAAQCGMCTPGQVVAAEAILRAAGDSGEAPSRSEVEQGMCGNLCRCGAYAGIASAVTEVAGLRATAGGAR